MIRCPYCGKELADSCRFCNACGRPVQQAPVQQPQYTQAPPQYQQYAQQQYTQTPPQQQYAPVQTMTYVQPQNTVSEREASEFLEITRRLLRWEAKAWKISGIAMTIIAAVYSAIFLLVGLILFDSDSVMGAVYLVYTVYFLILLLPIGIIGLKSAEKIPYYLNTIDRDIQPTVKRCSSIGMLVFTALFGIVAPIFFIINFVRMKANKRVIEKIISQQQ